MNILTWLVSYVLGFIGSYILLQNLIVFHEHNEFVRFSTKGRLLWSCFIFYNQLLSNFTEDTGGLRTERKWKLLSSRNVNNWNNFSPKTCFAAAKCMRIKCANSSKSLSDEHSHMDFLEVSAFIWLLSWWEAADKQVSHGN